MVCIRLRGPESAEQSIWDGEVQVIWETFSAQEE